MPPPDIIVIMTDQQRADLSRRWGYALDTTPRLDALAASGVWFDKAYTTAPACMPARESLLTGRWPSAHGVRTNFTAGSLRAHTDLFALFRAHGWRTALIGKNHTHLGRADADVWLDAHHAGAGDAACDPSFQAFDQFLCTIGHQSAVATPFPARCQLPFRLVERCLRCLADRADRRPLLAWLSLPEPHNPYQVPEPYWSLFPPADLPPTASSAADGERLGEPHRWCLASFRAAYPGFDQGLARARASYHGMLRLIDDAVGRLMDGLEADGRRDETLILAMSDHGDFAGEYGLMRKGAGCADVLMRIPLLACGAGVVRHAGPHPAHVSIADVLPTLCEAVGIAVPPGVQGRSLWPLLRGGAHDPAPFASVLAEQGYGGAALDAALAGRTGYDPTCDRFRPAGPAGEGMYDCLNSRTQSGSMRTLRHGSWKLTVDARGSVALHDLSEDPAELHDLSCLPAQAGRLRGLMAEALIWQARLADPLPPPGGTMRLFPVGT